MKPRIVSYVSIIQRSVTRNQFSVLMRRPGSRVQVGNVPDGDDLRSRYQRWKTNNSELVQIGNRTVFQNRTGFQNSLHAEICLHGHVVPHAVPQHVRGFDLQELNPPTVQGIRRFREEIYFREYSVKFSGTTEHRNIAECVSDCLMWQVCRFVSV